MHPHIFSIVRQVTTTRPEGLRLKKKVTITLGKVEDIQAIMRYGVLSTHGVVIDGKVVHVGGIPKQDRTMIL